MLQNMMEMIKVVSHPVSSGISRLEDGIEAQDIARQMKIGRSAASRYLNEMTRRGLLIKVNTRPVYFFDKEKLETEYKIVLNRTVYESFEELMEELSMQTTEKEDDPFVHMIGSTGSLRQQIEQCKAAISYPPKGLPFMIVGETGVGKSHLAQLIYEYSKDKSVISPDAPFITLNCAEFANNPELVTANLFGYVKGAFTGASKDTKGLIEEADGGILFLDEVHRLNSEGQEKLFLFMDKGIYHYMGDNGVWRNANVRMIFATTENLEETFLPTFLRRIPITVSIPSLKDRTDAEKYQLISDFYKKESKSLNNKLQLNADVIKALMIANIRGNIGELKNNITYSCAKAYTEFLNKRNANSIEINLKHLPIEVVKNFILNKRKNEKLNPFFKRTIMVDPQSETMQVHSRLEKNYFSTKIYEELLRIFAECSREVFDFDFFMEKSSILINQYLDKLIFSMQNNKEKMEFATIKHFVDSILELMDIDVKKNLSGNTVIALTHFIINASKENVQKIAEDNGDFEEMLQLYFSNEIDLAETIVSEVESTFNITMGLMDLAILAIYIRGFHNKYNANRIKAIIVAHGYSTASSIANLANRLLNESIFEAFDMPVEISTGQIFEKINIYLKSINTSKGVMVFVDMGSLVEIQDQLKNISAGTVGVLNNITTQIAIDAGEKIIQGLQVEEILREISESYKPDYKIIKPEINTKKNAIITTCITGIGTAVKIKELLDEGINQDSDKVCVLPYDFLSLKNNGKEDKVFDEYNVLGIVGTVNPSVSCTEFVAIEDIISGKEEMRLNELLFNILPKEKIHDITENIVKLFSLQGVINHLTILNPDKIIDHLSKALGKLQNSLELYFSNQTRISLYIHLSCLIERLVKKSPIEHYMNLTDFAIKHDDFIKIVKRAFQDIETTYSVEIPVSEIGYIYDIIKIKYDYLPY